MHATVSNVIYQKFSHRAASYTVNRKMLVKLELTLLQYEEGYLPQQFALVPRNMRSVVEYYHVHL